MDSRFCLDALHEAPERHGKPEISAQCGTHCRDNTCLGAQFTSAAFTAKREAAEIAISIDGSERCMDDILIERLWRSIKYEEVNLKAYSDGREARGPHRYPDDRLQFRTPSSVNLQEAQMIERLAGRLTYTKRMLQSVAISSYWDALLLGLLRSRPTLLGNIKQKLLLRPRVLQGLAVELSARAPQISDLVIFDEIFLTNVYNLSLIPFIPSLIVDCGAYRGYFTLLAFAKFPKAEIIAFEPQGENFRSLERNLALNKISQVHAIQAAVSNYNGKAYLEGGGCGGKIEEHSADNSVAAVDVVSLSQLLAGKAHEKVLVKIDVEGEEAKILPELIQSLARKTALFFEWHQGLASFEPVMSTLRAAGFSVEVTRENCFEGTTFIDVFALRS